MDSIFIGKWKQKKAYDVMGDCEIEFTKDSKINFTYSFYEKYCCYCDAGGCNKIHKFSGKNFPYKHSDKSICISCTPDGLLMKYELEHGNQTKQEVF